MNSLSQSLISIMVSGWWTARPWLVSRPSASPQLLHQFSVWPGYPLHQACSSPEVKTVSILWGMCDHHMFNTTGWTCWYVRHMAATMPSVYRWILTDILKSTFGNLKPQYFVSYDHVRFMH